MFSASYSLLSKKGFACICVKYIWRREVAVCKMFYNCQKDLDWFKNIINVRVQLTVLNDKEEEEEEMNILLLP